jgi:predicted RNA binding protein YcfA (HicA-like mRNA interferase family)
MSKLPVITSKKLVRILNKIGFQLDHKTGSHFIFYNPKSKKRTVVPYHIKDLPQGTLMNILKEAGITKEEFLRLVKK